MQGIISGVLLVAVFAVVAAAGIAAAVRLLRGTRPVPYAAPLAGQHPSGESTHA